MEPLQTAPYGSAAASSLNQRVQIHLLPARTGSAECRLARSSLPSGSRDLGQVVGRGSSSNSTAIGRGWQWAGDG